MKKPGSAAKQMALNIDVAPTILDLTGITIPAYIQGQSLVPILKNPNLPGRQAWLYEYFRDFPYRVPDIRAVRTQRYKYIEHHGRKGPELFDLTADPKEMRNLIDTLKGGEILPKLKGMMENLQKGKRL